MGEGGSNTPGNLSRKGGGGGGGGGVGVKKTSHPLMVTDSVDFLLESSKSE